MSELEIRVCANVETVLSDGEFIEPSGMDWQEECFGEVVRDFFDWLAAEHSALYDVTETDSNFQRWNGGRCDQFGSRSRHVWINDSAPSAKDLVSELDDKFHEILDARIAKFETETGECTA